MEEILPGILTWPWFSERHGYNFNGYLVRHASGNVCIDPVDMSDDVLDALADGASILSGGREALGALVQGSS